jgi:hypothetical protein
MPLVVPFIEVVRKDSSSLIDVADCQFELYNLVKLPRLSFNSSREKYSTPLIIQFLCFNLVKFYHRVTIIRDEKIDK